MRQRGLVRQGPEETAEAAQRPVEVAAALRLRSDQMRRRVSIARSAGLRVPLLRAVVRRQDRLLAERDELRAQHRLFRHLLNEERGRSTDAMSELQRLRRLKLLSPGSCDELRYVVLVTYGRSGSTLLQGILSATPGVDIRGENGGLGEFLWRYHRTALGHRDRVSWDRMVSPRHPWAGIDGYPEDLALRRLRELLLDTVLRPRPETRLAGFKEVRWPEHDLPDYLTFLQQLLPGCRFILNTRDLDETVRSGWWARTPDARKQLQALEQRLRDGLAGRGDEVFAVPYESYRNDAGALRPLFDWLQIPFDADRVRTVASLRHSY